MNPPSRTAVLAVSLLALGAVSVGVWTLSTRAGHRLDCPPEQLRVGPDGVARCGPGKDLSAPGKLTAGVRLSLNTSTADELAAIDGVGPALAKAIVDARGDAGFQSWEELDRVPGVGPARLEALKAVSTLDRP
jgi:competence protein ComEA